MSQECTVIPEISGIEDGDSHAALSKWRGCGESHVATPEPGIRFLSHFMLYHEVRNAIALVELYVAHG